MSNASKNSKVLHIWFNTTPNLFWCLILQGTCRTVIENISYPLDSLCSKLLWHLSLCQRDTNHVHDGLVSPLSHTILLWHVAAVIWRLMPSFLQNSSNSLEQNSLLLSVLRHQTGNPDSFSTLALWTLNTANAFDFSAIK